MRSQPASMAALSGIVMTLIGCATPAPLVRLQPTAADPVIWVGGRASVEKEGAGVRVAAAFEHQDGGTLGLRVEIENGTAARLDVGPQDMTFTSCVDETVSSCAPSHWVADPEQMLASLDVAASRNEAEAVNSQAFLGTLVRLNAVGNVASVASGHAGPSTGLHTAAAVDVMQSDAADRDSAQATIAERRQIWSDQALRRNTLGPGQGAGGLVFIPINLRAGYVWLNVHVADQWLTFRFKQIVTQVTIPVTQTSE